MKASRFSLLQRLYTIMVRVRSFEERLARGVLAGEIKTPCHLYVGQEAVAAGVCVHLKKTDSIFGTHRSHGHYLAKGGDMNALMAEIYGKETGCSRGHGGSMHIIQPDVGMMGAQPLVAGTIPIAVGSALASSINGDKRVTVVFFGDGAVEEGTFYEAMNFAALKKLSIIFVCENNFYSSHLHIRERRPANNIYKTGALFKIPGVRVDGNDVEKVAEVAQKLIKRARTGKGPALIEAMTYRLRGHVGAVDNTNDQDVTDIRDPKEIAKWLRREPIQRFERTMIKKKIFSQKDFDDIRQNALRQVEVAYEFTGNARAPVQLT